MSMQPWRQGLRPATSMVRSLVWIACLITAAYQMTSYIIKAKANRFMGDANDRGGVPNGLPLSIDKQTRGASFSPEHYHNFTHMDQRIVDMHTGDKDIDNRIDKLLKLNFSTEKAEAHQISGFELYLSGLSDPFYRCNRRVSPNLTECSFANICLYRPNSPQQHWFTMKDMGYKNDVPFQIKRIDRTVYRLPIDVYPFTNRTDDDIDITKPIHYIDEDLHVLNTQFGHRWFIYQKALSLYKSIQTLSKKEPYHTLYMTHYGDGTEMVPLHFWEDKHVEVFEKFTYNKRPLGTFPGALRDIKEDTVCFKTIHFQYDDEMTARLRGHSNLQAKHESSMSQISDPLTADKHFVNTNYYKMLQLASGFQKKMHKSFKVDQIPMIPNRCLLITRREGRNGHDTFREIVNEEEIVRLLERYGLDVDMVDFATISSYEQIIRTRQASVFIGMHGAGMANTLWLHRDAKVIELQTYGFHKWGYRNLMYALGIAYHHWINTHPQSALHTYRSQHSEGKFDFYRSRNQIVDIDEIEQVIRTALLPADVIALEHVLLCVKWTAVLLTVYTVVSVVVTRRYGCRALGKS